MRKTIKRNSPEARLSDAAERREFFETLSQVTGIGGARINERILPALMAYQGKPGADEVLKSYGDLVSLLMAIERHRDLIEREYHRADKTTRHLYYNLNGRQF